MTVHEKHGSVNCALRMEVAASVSSSVAPAVLIKEVYAYPMVADVDAKNLIATCWYSTVIHVIHMAVDDDALILLVISIAKSRDYVENILIPAKNKEKCKAHEKLTPFITPMFVDLII